MTQHNISGSEAFAPNAHVVIRLARRMRKPWHPAAKLLTGSAVIGLVASLVDSWIGAPVCLTLCGLVFLGLWIWPGN